MKVHSLVHLLVVGIFLVLVSQANAMPVVSFQEGTNSIAVSVSGWGSISSSTLNNNASVTLIGFLTTNQAFDESIAIYHPGSTVLVDFVQLVSKGLDLQIVFASDPFTRVTVPSSFDASIAEDGSFQTVFASLGPGYFKDTLTVKFKGDMSEPAPVPEPGTLLLLGSGLVALTGAGWIRHRRQ